ncbi:MAG: hypothetical protein AAF804_10975 [Bacteroidota bacterium]
MGKPFFITLLISLIILPTGLWAQQEDCRLKPEDLKPIIVRFNPFFANHKWEPEAQMELAQLSGTHLLAITQEGCKRHHVKFDLVVSPEACQNSHQFWVDEVKNFMPKVYWERTEYQEFGTQFEEKFAEKLLDHGFNRPFNFPIGTRNFICSVYYHPDHGARVSIEVVSFIFKENVETRERQPKSQEDDAWKGVKDPSGQKG